MADAPDILAGIDIAEVLGAEITKEDLDLLPDHEKEAIADMAKAADPEPEPEAVKEPDPKPEPEAAPEPEAPEAAKPEADPAKPAEPAAADPAPEPESEAPAPKPTPEPEQPKLPDISKVEETTAALKATRKEALDRYNDGELSEDELNTELDRITGELAAEQAKVALHTQMTEDAQAKADRGYWGTIEAIKVDNAALWAPEHARGFDAAVREVQGHPVYSTLPLDQQIQIGAKNYVTAMRAARPDFSIALSPDMQAYIDGAKPAPTPPPNDPKHKPKDGKPDPQPSLSTVPQSDTGPNEDGEFAVLDRLMDEHPDQAEAALARLPEWKQEQYLSTR